MSESLTMPGKMILEGLEFALSTNENGTEYVLLNKEEKSSAHLEGDDGEILWQEYQTLQTQFTGYDADQLLAQLWDQGGYSWMAIPIKEAE